MEAAFSDDFNRANNPTVGNGWTQLQASTGSTHGIINNQVGIQNNTVTSGTNTFTAHRPLAGCIGVQAVLSAFHASALHQLLLAFTPPTSTINLIGMNGYGVTRNTTSLFLYRVDAGTSTQIGAYSAARVLGDVVKLYRDGDSIKADLNGSTVITVTDVAYPVHDYVGVRTWCVRNVSTQGALNAWDNAVAFIAGAASFGASLFGPMNALGRRLVT